MESFPNTADVTVDTEGNIRIGTMNTVLSVDAATNLAMNLLSASSAATDGRLAWGQIEEAIEAFQD